jgi:hypothetical protein
MRAGLWLANLKIAEDRIPSLFAVFSEPGAAKTLIAFASFAMAFS